MAGFGRLKGAGNRFPKSDRETSRSMLRASTLPDRLASSVRGDRILTFIAALCLIQALVLSVIRTGTSYDGAEQLLYTQSLEWGYGRSQPPLYTWLLIAVQQVFGVTQLAENLLKFSLLFAFCFLMWRIAIRLGLRRTAAGVVAISPFLVYEIAWEVQRNYSHSVLLLALTAAFALCYLRTLAKPDVGHYALMGLVLGLMALTKYNGVLFVGALVAADLATMRRDGVFWSAKAVLIPAIAAILVAPHAVWALNHASHVLALVDRFKIAETGGRLAGLGRGLLSYVMACLAILGLPALVMFFSGGWATIRGELRGVTRVFACWAMLSLAFGLVLVFATGTTHVNVRWMLPVVVAALPILCGLVADTIPRAARNFTLVAVSMAVIASVGQWIESWPSARKSYNYRELSREVQQATGASELLINDYAVLANLRLYAPETRVLHPIMPAAASFPLKKPVMVWTDDDDGAGDVHEFARALGVCPAEPAPRGFTLRSRGGKELNVHYQALKTTCP